MLALTKIGSNRGFFESFHPPKVSPTLPPGQSLQTRFSSPLAACLILLCGVGVATLLVSGRQEIIPDRTSFAQFPTKIADWGGRASSMEPEVEHFLGLTD